MKIWKSKYASMNINSISTDTGRERWLNFLILRLFKL